MSLVVSEVGLLQYGPTVSLQIDPGQSLCIVGPAAAGKSKLLRVLTGREQADRGFASLPGSAVFPESCNRKLRPQDLSHRKGSNQAALATEVLSQLGLWDVRQRLIGELPQSQVSACDLVEMFMAQAPVLAFDGHLDMLDPWTRAGALRLIRDRCSQGAVCLCATNHLELATQFDHLIVMKDHQAVYHGRVSDLTAARGQRSVTIESERNAGVRALVDPLLVAVNRTESGYKLVPGPGQEHTAKLLREGYGDVKFVVSDERSLPEIVLGLVE